MGHADEGHRPDGLDGRPPLRDRLREARAEQAPFKADHRSLCKTKAKRSATEPVLIREEAAREGICVNSRRFRVSPSSPSVSAISGKASPSTRRWGFNENIAR